MDPQTKRNSGTSPVLPQTLRVVCGFLGQPTHARASQLSPPVPAPSCARALLPCAARPAPAGASHSRSVLVPLYGSSALDDVESGIGSTARPDRTRKRKCTIELDALLLREVKLHKPHEQRHGRIGNVYESIADSLIESERFPWITDRKHLQGRVQHLLVARRTNQRATARATGIEEEHGELEILFNDVIEEADAFKSTEVERREVRQHRDFAMAKGGRKARRHARPRRAPVDESDDARAAQSVEVDSDGGSGANEPEEIEREPRSSTPVSVAHRNVPAHDNEEVQIMQLLQTSASAISTQASRVAEVGERKLRLEEGIIEREGEIEKRRIKVEEDRDA
jgi:hypothetical protein